MSMALEEVDVDGAPDAEVNGTPGEPSAIRSRSDMVYQTGSSDRCISVELIGGEWHPRVNGTLRNQT